MTAPTIDIEAAYALLWEMAEDPHNERDACKLRRIAGALKTQQAEIDRLRQAVEGKRAA